MIFIKHFFSLINRTSIILGYFPVAIFIFLTLGKNYRISLVKKWHNLSHFCYVITSKTNDKKFFLKVRNPFSSIYNFVSGRNLPATKEQIESFNKLPPEVNIFFPKVIGLNGFVIMDYLEDFWSPEVSLLTNDDREYIAKEAIRMLDVLHNAGFVHGDLKLKNILYKNKEIKKLFFIDIDYLENLTPERLAYEKLQEKSLLKTLGFFTDKK